MEIDSHIGTALSGLTADARTMIDHARVETQVCVCVGFVCFALVILYCVLSVVDCGIVWYCLSINYLQ